MEELSKAVIELQLSYGLSLRTIQKMVRDVYKNTNDSRAKSDSGLQTEIETKLTNEGYKVEEGKITIGKAETIDIAKEIKKSSTGGNGGTQGGETAGKEETSGAETAEQATI